MNKKKLAAAITAIKNHKAAIAKHRDELRSILSDLEEIVEAADDGLQSLDYAVDALSQHL